MHVQLCVEKLAQASVSSWQAWYSPDRPVDHTSLTTVLVAVASLSLQPTPSACKLAQLTASALQSNFECSAMRSPTMTPSSDVIDVILAFSRLFGVSAIQGDSRHHPAATLLPHPCIQHCRPSLGVDSALVDSNQSSGAQCAGESAPTRHAGYERVPADVHAFVNTACEELRMRVLPAVHSVNPPMKPQDVVSLLSGVPRALHAPLMLQLFFKTCVALHTGVYKLVCSSVVSAAC